MVFHTVLFPLWNLEIWGGPRLDGVNLRRLDNYEEALQKVKKGQEAVTAIAEITLETSNLQKQHAVIEEATLRLRPYLLLFTLAQGVWIDWTARYKVRADGRVVFIDGHSAPPTRPHPSDLIWAPYQEEYVKQCAPLVSSSGFLEKTLFAIALSWRTQANEQVFVETEVLFRYTPLEALSWGFVKHTYSGDPVKMASFTKSPEDKVRHFLNEIGLPLKEFFPHADELFELRNHIVHRGMTYERSKRGPFAGEILALRGLLDCCFLTVLGYRGEYRDIRRRGEHRKFPEEIITDSVGNVRPPGGTAC